MNLSRILYRSRQFWKAALGRPPRIESGRLLPYLSSEQVVLFRRMQPLEQGHAFQVLERLKASGQDDRDLLVAALLHDVGKCLHPLSLWERVAIVLGKRLFPKAARRWSQSANTAPRGLRWLSQPFVVAARHAEWGAGLAFQAGVSPRTVDLIRHHHASSPVDDPLLAPLQQADDSE